jgi:hypothetical protein
MGGGRGFRLTPFFVQHGLAGWQELGALVGGLRPVLQIELL